MIPPRQHCTVYRATSTRCGIAYLGSGPHPHWTISLKDKEVAAYSARLVVVPARAEYKTVMFHHSEVLVLNLAGGQVGVLEVDPISPVRGGEIVCT